MNELWAPRIYSLSGFNRHIELGAARALDVGCGSRKLPGATGMDLLQLPGVDIVHDIDRIPWPVKDSTFDLVFLNHALEHVTDVIAVMNEVHRILKPRGHVVIQVPYFRSTDAYGDPTHKHFFTARTLDYVIEGSTLAAYKYSDRLFTKRGFWYGWPHSSRNPLKRFVKNLLTANERRFDQYFSLFFPIACLTWELEPVQK